MRELFELETYEEKIDLIQTHIRAIVAKNQADGHLNYYPFDNQWIEKHKFNWEQQIEVSANRKFTEYALLQSSPDTSGHSYSTYYVHGPKYKDLIKVSSLKANNYVLDVAYFAKLPGDAVCRHSRN